MKKLILVLAAVLPFLFISCKGAEELKGNWNTTAITLNGESVKVVESFVNLQPSGSKVKVYGNAGVNVFNGDVKASEGKLESNGFACTRMMGSPEQMACEDAFLEIISYADSYTVEGDILTIRSSSKNGEIKFKKE